MTGVFCHSAITGAEKDQDLVVQALLHEKVAIKNKLMELFERVDDGTGRIGLAEFEMQFENESVKAVFESLGLGTMDAWTLFQILDSDGNRFISLICQMLLVSYGYGPACAGACLRLNVRCCIVKLMALKLNNCGNISDDVLCILQVWLRHRQKHRFATLCNELSLIDCRNGDRNFNMTTIKFSGGSGVLMSPLLIICLMMNFMTVMWPVRMPLKRWKRFLNSGVECGIVPPLRAFRFVTISINLEASNRLRNNGPRFRLRLFSRLQFSKKTGLEVQMVGLVVSWLPCLLRCGVTWQKFFKPGRASAAFRRFGIILPRWWFLKRGVCGLMEPLLSASCDPSAFSVVGGECIVELGCREFRNSHGWNVTLWVIKPVAAKTGLARPPLCNWQSVLPRKSSLPRLIMLRLLITLVLTWHVRPYSGLDVPPGLLKESYVCGEIR